MVEGGGSFGYATPMWGRAANKISKGLRPVRVLFLIRMYIKTIGRALVHGRPVSSQHFASLAFRVPFCRSTAPPLGGMHNDFTMKANA